MEKTWYTIKEVCEYSRMSECTIHRAIKERLLKVARTGTGNKAKCGKMLFKIEWVDAFIMNKNPEEK